MQRLVDFRRAYQDAQAAQIQNEALEFDPLG